MPIGVSEDHVELHDAARRWIEGKCPPSVPRALLDADSETRPTFWESLAELHWMGLAVDEEHGGVGLGIAELVVIVEELGRVAAPGPFLPCVVGAALLERGGNATAAKTFLPGIAAGELVATVAFGAGLVAEEAAEGLRVTGEATPVLSGHLADIVLAPVTVDGSTRWCVLADDQFVAEELPSLDLTRRVARVTVDTAGTLVGDDRTLPALDDRAVADTAAVLFAAEAVGVAQSCVDTASAYATEREQFGRPIGQFQGVKHRCADMLARLELARAATWDAARTADEGVPEAGSDDPGSVGDTVGFTAAVAAALSLDAAVENAKDLIQVLGGIGFTWEHDAHLYLRRATTLRALVGPGDRWRVRAARLAADGVKRRLDADLPPEAETYRSEVREFLATVDGQDSDDARSRMAESGYLTPSWPKPWGRDADAVEQLVIDEEFRRARLRRPVITIAGWALPTIIVYGTPEQQERWIMPTLRGELEWCQLFSEPGAGSDLAGLTTRAERDGDVYRVNGQKVWTSLAQHAQWGIALFRTDPDAPKHEGISCFMVDMSLPGIDIRPIRELTGQPMFNEVFFDDVEVPADCLVGDEGDGWRAARTALANERVFMGSGRTVGRGVRGILKILERTGRADDPGALDTAGRLVAESHALACLGFRLTLSALTGADPSGSEAAVRKLLSVHHDQDVQEVGLAFLGAEGAVMDGEAAAWGRQFLFNRQLTIAGGTSEVQRNIIGERILGLPKD
ncbi:MAG: acyl-CoA dehydrogenase [Acidimicrobiia bacterium]